MPRIGAQWVESPDEDLVKYELYIDGKAVNYEEHVHASIDGTANQFCIAGFADSPRRHFYTGQLDEVRVWNKPRTLEQITDNGFGTLKGEREDLIAYYKFEFQPHDEITQPGIHDSSDNGIDLKVEGIVYRESNDSGDETVKQLLSSAPISTEIPIIHQAMSNVVYAQMSVNSAYGAVEYGDIQKDEEGVINGVLKRAYSIIGANKEWRLTTGYKVGNLKSQWYSQVQYDPQVMGYIEGPPPIPQENMPDPKNLSFFDMYEMLQENYVSFEQVDEVQYTYDTSKEKGYQVAFESSSDIGADISTLIAPFGFGIELEAQVTAKANSDWQHNHKQSQSLNSGAGLNIDKTMSARAVCYETDKGEFKLGNMGFALVKSKTADVYLLRMEHNDQLVSIYYEPSKDIPEDNNIIPFPIDPLYTKQGCLDGKTGEHADTHYPNAQLAYGEYSYFKPKEAYILKKKIERKQKYLQTYYEDVFDEQQVSNHFQLAAGLTGGMQALGAIPMSGGVVTSLMNQTLGQVATNIAYRNMQLKDDLVKVVSTRNICNQYIWTLDGGLYQEETQTISMQQETYSGDNDLDLGGGAGYGLSIKAGAESTSSFLFKSSSNLSVTKSKTKDSTQTFNVNVGLQLPLQSSFEYGGLSKRTLIKSSVKPGTVDAYRFMSFYLEPSSKNFSKLFDEVIDQKWLAESPHPNAIALRQAMGKAEAKKPCWRIFHRVTFVSRILPEFKKKASGTLEEAMDQLGIVSNYMLIKSFEPYVKGIKNADAFRSKIDRVITKKFPTLQKHDVTIKKYLVEYFDIISEVASSDSNVARVADAPTLKRLHLGGPAQQPATGSGQAPTSAAGATQSPLHTIGDGDDLQPIHDQLPGSASGQSGVSAASGVHAASGQPSAASGAVSARAPSRTIPITTGRIHLDAGGSYTNLYLSNSGQFGTCIDFNHGYLYLSNDGGYRWHRQDKASFYAEKAWVSEDGATIIVIASNELKISLDGGTSWKTEHPKDDLAFHHLSVSLSGLDGVVFNYKGGFYTLSRPDGRSDYTLTHHHFIYRTTSAAVTKNGQIMVAGTEIGQIYVSMNGGRDWTEQPICTLSGEVGRIAIIEGVIIAVIYHFDGGADIFHIPLNSRVPYLLHHYDGEDVTSSQIAVSRDERMVAVSTNDLNRGTGHLWISDGSSSDHLVTVEHHINSVAISDIGYVTYTADGTFSISRDWGQNWEHLKVHSNYIFNTILSDQGRRIMILGGEHDILLSENGGHTFVSN